MSAASFNPQVLQTLESDALNAAAMRLQSSTPPRPLTADALIGEANKILPQARNGEAIRMFFSTRHETQDEAFDNIKDLGVFLVQRAGAAEKLSQSAPALWRPVLDDLAEGYSYVIEMVENLADCDLIAERRVQESRTLTEPPVNVAHPSHWQFFALAHELYESRKDGGEGAAPAAPRS